MELELDDFFFSIFLFAARGGRMGIAGHWHCDYGTSSRTVQCSSHIALHQEPTIVLEYPPLTK